MGIFTSFLPIILFIIIYVGSGLYFLAKSIPNAFGQISPVIAIIPSIILGWLLNKGSSNDRMDLFLKGVKNRDVIMMCIIFLLAGAFGVVTQSIGSVDATVNMFLSFVPTKFFIIGLFISIALISTAIGSSMGSIAALGPIVLALSKQGVFPIELGIATLVGGAMFGDNLSIISDTTIVAVTSQKADFRKKLKVNAIVALISAAITIAILSYSCLKPVNIVAQDFSEMLIFPYLFLIVLALLGIDVFIVLTLSIIVSGIIGFMYTDLSMIKFCKDITQGFSSMQEIMLLAMFVGGLSGLTSKGFSKLTKKISTFSHKKIGKKVAQLLIAGMVSIFDILFANNTVAIIFSGKIAKEIAEEYHIPAHYSAAWLDIFSCVFKGIMPYGSQILLASAITGVCPLSIIGKVYYCYVLGIVSISYILIKKV
jgi:Na+/H+ antiporter NhaC